MTGGGLHLVDQEVPQRLKVDAPQNLQNCFGAHAGLENIAVVFLQFAIVGLGDQLVNPKVVQFVDAGLKLLLECSLFGGQTVFDSVQLHHGGHTLYFDFRTVGGFFQLSNLLADDFQFRLGRLLALFNFQVVSGPLFLNGFLAGVLIHRHDYVLGEVQDPLQISGREVQQ